MFHQQCCYVYLITATYQIEYFKIHFFYSIFIANPISSSLVQWSKSEICTLSLNRECDKNVKLVPLVNLNQI